MKLVSIMPEAIVRRARKAWTCVECEAPIAAGEEHVEYVGESHAFESGSRYCAKCAVPDWAELRWTAEEFPTGTLVSFADSNATTSTQQEGVVRGPVNGPVLADDDGTVTHVPVFAARDNGRESSTVYVAVVNVLGAEAPSR